MIKKPFIPLKGILEVYFDLDNTMKTTEGCTSNYLIYFTLKKKFGA